MVEILLKQLGFNAKEIELYLAILQKGKILPSALAQLTNINRSTVYSVARALIKKGVIMEDLGDVNKHLIALPPSGLAKMLAKEEQVLNLKKAKLNTAIQELEKIALNTKYSIPKIIFIAEEELHDYLLNRTPVWNESILAHDKTWWGFQDHTFVEYYQEWLDWYYRQKPVELQVKLLTNKSGIEENIKIKKQYHDREIRYFADSQKFTGTIWINGDYLVMIVTQSKPFYLIEIYDKTLALNLRELFKNIWKSYE